MTPFGIACSIFGVLMAILVLVLGGMSAFSSTKGYAVGELLGKSDANAYLTQKMSEFRQLDFKTVASGSVANIVLGILVFAYFVSLVTVRWDFETPANLSNKASTAAASYAPYATMPRNAMATTVQRAATTIPQEQLVLTNFYVSTANVAGLCFVKTNSEGTRAIYNKDAIRLSLLGGARAFVFDCWPDTTAGDYQHGPVVQTVEPGSLWRRTSFTATPLAAPLSELMTQAFNSQYPSTSNDLIIVYLRFRTKDGKTPRSDTMNLTAQILQSTIQPYRMDAAFNRCRAQDQIALLPLTTFAGKVLIVSNFNGAGTALADYINVWHGQDELHRAMEATTSFAKNLPEAQKPSAIKSIQQQLTFVAPYGEDPAAESNAWDTAGAQAVGVHCCGLNMDPARVPQSLKTMFVSDSFAIKPEALRYIPTTLPTPGMPPASFAAMGAGPTPGAIQTPPAMRVPG